MIEKILDRLDEASERYEDIGFAEIGNNGHTLDFEYAKGKMEGIVEAISIVQEVAAEYNNGWIPVTYHVATDEEREEMCLSDDITYILDCPMPDDEQEIIVCSKSYVWTDTCIIDDGYSLDSGHDWCEDIVAWMPMPKKYEPKKPEGEQKKYCSTCHWYAEDVGTCVNGESEHCADFRRMDDTCDKYQPKGE